jgi:hypothetical protein
MGALSPFFLLAGLAIGVPLFLHLFQRQEVRRVSFPALRYLERTEREHARRIRLRQLLLMLTRVAVVLALVGAGARLFLRGTGAAHPPTAVVLILDNSMSSGLVLGEARALDRLRTIALQTLDAATRDDVIWVLRAGEPWLPAVPGGPDEARQTVLETTVSAGAGNLSQSLGRASELLGTSALEAHEIHLVSDLQRTAFDTRVSAPAMDIPVVVWSPRDPADPNRALTSVLVGGGLPPLEGQRTQVTVASAEDPDGDTVPIPVRVVVDEVVRGAGDLPPGASLSLPLPSTPSGWVQGYVDADPDDLRADDRRFFVFRARPAPSVSVVGDPGVFMAEAISVLESAGRTTPSAVSVADAVISGSGEGLTSVGSGKAALVVPPEDPTRLPALNRRLAEAGIPWRLERREERGEADVDGADLPEPLTGIRARMWYRLVLSGDPPAPTRTLGVVVGDPWLVSGTDASGRRYLLLASPLDPGSSTLPVSAQMVRFVDWVVSEWAAAGGGPVERSAGQALTAPGGAERVRLPSGAELPIDGARRVLATGEVGFYTFSAGDSTVAVEAVNPPARESDLRRLEDAVMDVRIGSNTTRVRGDGAWARSIFQERQGPELWSLLLAMALALLVVESALAATGRLTVRHRASGRGEAASGAI